MNKLEQFRRSHKISLYYAVIVATAAAAYGGFDLWRNLK